MRRERWGCWLSAIAHRLFFSCVSVRALIQPSCDPSNPLRHAGTSLAEAIAAWQAKRSLERVLTTGFLDGSHPLVDSYGEGGPADGGRDRGRHGLALLGGRCHP